MAEGTELATIGQAGMLSVSQVKEQVQVLQRLMAEVLIDGEHFGKIPGAGDKPTLFKAGAEKICSMFRIVVDPEIEDLSTDDEIRYRIRCRGLTMDGRLIGVGVGEASSNEEKYKWRAARCDEEWKEADEGRRRRTWKPKYQGGKVLYKGGKKVYVKILQVRATPADVANTILKMANKRAKVDLCLTVTAASDIFAQDLEDRPSVAEEPGEAQTPIKSPKSKSSTKGKPKGKGKGKTTAKTGGTTWTGIVKEVKLKKQTSEYTLFDVLCEGETFQTFEDGDADFAASAAKEGFEVTITFETSKYGKKIVEIAAAE